MPSTVGVSWVETMSVAALSLACAAWATAQGAAPSRATTSSQASAKPDALVVGRDGNLYGTTSQGGKRSARCRAGCGTVFRITPSGELTTLHAFMGGRDGQVPIAGGLLPASDDSIYGVTTNTVFRITTAGKLKTLHVFTNRVGPPVYGLLESRDGNLYGGNCCSVMKIESVGTLTVLHEFAGRWGPISLVQGEDGSLYGTTGFGGPSNNRCAMGCGTVFKVTAFGELTTLHVFDGGLGGQYPSNKLVEAPDGSFYGTTGSGGAPSDDCVAECGTIFKITPSGTLTTLYSFGGNSSFPAGLVFGTNGNFYGVTFPRPAGKYKNGGTVFEFSASGALTTLHEFTAVSDSDDPDGRNSDSNGAWPGNLIQGHDGNFYGTTAFGGCDRPVGCGTVFKITSSGILTTLHTFSGGQDGNSPNGLIEGADGSLYGTTQFGGDSRADCPSGCGTVFKVTTSGEFETLHRFGGGN
jgi:uncharacterized repeat protein (TIGR03803 family)